MVKEGGTTTIDLTTLSPLINVEVKDNGIGIEIPWGNATSSLRWIKIDLEKKVVQV